MISVGIWRVKSAVDVQVMVTICILVKIVCMAYDFLLCLESTVFARIIQKRKKVPQHKRHGSFVNADNGL